MLAVEALPGVDGEMGASDNEMGPFQVDGFVFLIGFFFFELDVLQGRKRSPDLLGVISFLILCSPLLALVRVVVVLASSLDAVFHPFWVRIYEEDLLVACLFDL